MQQPTTISPQIAQQLLKELDYEIWEAKDRANNTVYTDHYRNGWKDAAHRIERLKERILKIISNGQ